jgi:hypothetical protein
MGQMSVCPGQVAGGNPVDAWSFTPIHSLTGPVGQPFASRIGDSGSRPGDAPALTIEPDSPVSDVSLQRTISRLRLGWAARLTDP